GIYTIVVTNQAGATSAAARLYVVTLPVITRHPTPTNQSVSVGANATFTAAATASSVVHTNYEWRHGDGSFTKVTAGSPVNDGGESLGCAWGDYDNDGFLDLFVGNGGNTCSDNDENQRNFLYQNNGNSNSWVSIK